MDLSLDGMYRAVLRGMQVGLGSAFIVILVKTAVTLPGLQKISPLAVFCTGMLLGVAFAFYRDSLKVSLNGKSVLITGCDSGFGYELALRLEKMGAIVFAGCLKSQCGGAQELRELNLKRLHVIQMDVTSDEQVAAAVAYVSRHIPPQGLWAVVNNAGLNSFGYAEWVPIGLCKKVMDVNVWGAVRVIRAFLPLLRDTKGRIVNLSSALSRFSLPNRSTYGITKYGIQALSDCLRFEVKHWGISVSIIEPGSLVSGVFTEDSVKKEAADLWNQIPEPVQKVYTKEFYDNIIRDMLKHSTMGATPKTPVVDAYVMALVHRFPHPRYQPMELKMKIMVWMNTHLPEWVFEKIFT